MSRQSPESGPEPDSILAARVSSSDKGAFDELYLRYHSTLWRYAYRYVRSDAIADEIVQDVFLAIWENRSGWKIREGVDRYLYTSVRNAAIRYLKRETLAERWTEENVVNQRQSPREEPRIEDAIVTGELDRALAKAVEEMTPARRRVVKLRFGYELDYAEIAEILGISVEAATIQVARAREALKKVRERF